MPTAAHCRLGEADHLDIVDAAARGDTTRFLAGAGILAHYVGDACQPLHASYLHHGVPGADEGAVHADYETSLLGKYRKNIVTDVQAKSDHIVVANCFVGVNARLSTWSSHAKHTKTLPPTELLAAWRQAKTGGNKLDNSVGGRR